MQKENKYYVFDLDGTILYKGKFSRENKRFILNIDKKLRVLNTSRKYEDIPKKIKKLFPNIMTLNGSFFYQNNKIIKSFNLLSKSQVNKIIKDAVKNNYNISFNSTKGPWFNVKEQKSIDFMNKNKIKYTKDIIIPSEVFLMAISHYEKVKEIKAINYFRQSIKFVEYTNNSKANIYYFYKNYVAYGDNNNDKPMFDKAKEYFVIKEGKLKNE